MQTSKSKSEGNGQRSLGLGFRLHNEALYANVRLPWQINLRAMVIRILLRHVYISNMVYVFNVMVLAFFIDTH